MNIFQLIAELTHIEVIAVIVALLPKHAHAQALRERQLQIVHRIDQQCAYRISEEHVNMLRHHHVSVDAQREALPHLFQNLEKEIVGGRRIEPSSAMVASEYNEMRLLGLLAPLEPMRHGKTSVPGRRRGWPAGMREPG